MLHTNFELKHVKSISEVPREVLTSTDNNDDEVLETSTVTNPAQSALSGFLINKKVRYWALISCG